MYDGGKNMKLGIDFGTTNTAVSCLGRGEPESLGFGDGHKYRYVPSVLACRKTKTDVRNYYGWEAKNMVGEPGLEVYQNFKMLLGEAPETVRQHWGDTRENPEGVTRAFIRELLRQVQEDHKIRPKGVVVTVPEVWVPQNLQIRREKLIHCFQDQGIATVEVQSEPVAAGSYYLHCYQKKKGKPFSGHLLVCDCGGGTMDFCLVKVENDGKDRHSMKVVDRAGNGLVNGRIGSAGVAYDQAVVKAVFPDIQVKKPTLFFKRVREFEEGKIFRQGTLSQTLGLYLELPEAVEKDVLMYLGDETPVYACHLADVFEKEIRPSMKESLTVLVENIQAQGIDIQNGESFKVLMVGGFSAFFLVQETIRRAFGNVMSGDLRFDDLFALEDRALAISKGAALIANDLTEVIETCPMDVGIQAFDIGKDRSVRIRMMPVLKKAEKMEKYRKPVWLAQDFLVANPSIEIPVYLEPVPGKPFSLKLSGTSLKALMPKGLSPESYVQVGFSMDSNKIFSIHIREKGKPKAMCSTTLGDLMAHVPALLVVDGGKK